MTSHERWGRALGVRPPRRPVGPRRAGRGRERGMVTVETAFATLVLAGVAALAIAVAGAVFTFGQCHVTANEVARQLARGDGPAVARATADAPRDAVVDTRREEGAVVVEVRWTATVGPFAAPLVARALVLEER